MRCHAAAAAATTALCCHASSGHRPQRSVHWTYVAVNADRTAADFSPSIAISPQQPTHRRATGAVHRSTAAPPPSTAPPLHGELPWPTEAWVSPLHRLPLTGTHPPLCRGNTCARGYLHCLCTVCILQGQQPPVTNPCWIAGRCRSGTFWGPMLARPQGPWGARGALSCYSLYRNTSFHGAHMEAVSTRSST